MPSQSDFPEKWTCETPQKGGKLEVRVPKQSLAELANIHGSGLARALAQSRGPEDYNWIEIPIVEAELYIQKGDAAQIQRTAKVKVPSVWGENTDDVLHNSPRQILTRFDHQIGEQFLFARLSFKRGDGQYVLSHFGWVGGIGPSSQEGVSKMWIYDAATMLSGVSVSTTFNSPTVEEAARRIARLINDNSPLPITDLVIAPPETDAEFEQLVSVIGEELFTEGPLGGQPITTYLDFDFLSFGEVKELGHSFAELQIDTGLNIPVAGLDTKSFTDNHDTLTDVIDWFEQKTASKISFEPTPSGNGLALLVDIHPTRRTWAQREAVQENIIRSRRGEADPLLIHDIVDVIKNNALYEIKPINTLYLRGDTSWSFMAPGGAPPGRFYEVETDASPSLRYPSVKVQVPALVQAAEGFELAPETIESDAETIEAAEQEAIAQLRKILSEETEGSILMKGHPQVMPFDKIISYEECDSDIIFERDPAHYEVEQVKHTTSGGDIYKTRVTVSVWANDDNIEVVESKMVKA